MSLHIIFIISLELFKEVLFSYEFFGRKHPVLLFLLSLCVHLLNTISSKKYANGFKDIQHRIEEHSNRLELGDIRLLNRVERLCGSFESGNGLIEVFLTVCLDGLGLIGRFLSNCCLTGDLLLLFLSDQTFCLHNLSLLIDFLRFDDKLRLELFKCNLHLSNALLSRNQLGVTVTITITLLSHFFTLREKQLFERVDKLEITGRCDVVVTLLVLKEPSCLFLS